MNIKVVFCFLLVLNSIKGSCQKTDSLFVSTSKEIEIQNGLSLYSVIMENFTESPICILHSIFINLFYNPPQKLALFDKIGSTEIYSLEYSMHDTLYDYDGPVNNFNGEVILPGQHIQFRFLIKNSDLNKKLKFEYFPVPDFCYADFKKEIFKDATQWHKKYKRKQRLVDLQQ